jgi:hypothetical protein
MKTGEPRAGAGTSAVTLLAIVAFCCIVAAAREGTQTTEAVAVAQSAAAIQRWGGLQ